MHSSPPMQTEAPRRTIGNRVMRIRRLRSCFILPAALALCAFALVAQSSPAQERGGIRDLFGQGGSAIDGLKPHGPKVEFSLLPANAKSGDTVTLSAAVTVPR